MGQQVGGDWLADLEVRARTHLERVGHTGSDADSLQHELRVHRIELEMQNEEMRNSQHALEQECQRYRAVLEAAPLGYLALDPTGRICDVTRLGARLLRQEVATLRDRHLQAFLCVADADRFHIQFRESLSTTTPQTVTVAIGDEGRPASIELRIVPTSADDSVSPAAWVFMTEVKQHLSNRQGLTAGESLTAARELFPKRLSLELDDSAFSCRAMATPRDLERIAFHLCVYALEANPSEEQMTLRVGRLESTETAEQVPYLKLSLGDTSSAGDREESRTLFDHGPGLAKLAHLVRRCGGLVNLSDSQGDAGARIEVLLPLVRQKKRKHLGVSAIGERVVLVVDDDAAVRKAVSRILRVEGYQVVAASSGEEALEIARAEHQRLDVLLSDVRMPGMNGGELGQHMASLRPDLPRLYMSGDVGDVVLEPGATLVSKPFHPDSLLRLLDKCMSSK